MSDTFAVTEDFQTKTLAFMLHNEEFCGIAGDSLGKEQFTNKALQWFYDKITSRPLTPVLLQEEMITAAKSKEIKQEDVQKFIGLYEVLRRPPAPAEQDYISEKLGTFIRTQAVKQVMLESLQKGGLVETGQWETIEERMRAATQAGFELQNLGKSYFNDVEDRVAERATRQKSRRIATGIPELDALTYGGIRNKQTGIIIGGTGRGKSIFLQWLARTAILLGKRVLYITMELSEEDISDRFDSMFARVRPHELNDYQEQVIKEVGNLGTMYGDALRIKHFPMNTATVGTFKAYVRQLSNIGLAPDLILIDYLDLIAPHQRYSSRTEEQIAVVQAVVGFGQEFDVAIWTACQLNRGGLIMETPDESAQAGSIERQFVADMVFWLAQTKDERMDEIMRIVCSKNRNGKTGWTIGLDTDYSYMTFYREQPEIAGDDDGQSEGDEETQGTAGEERQAPDEVGEERDLRRLFLESEQEHAAVQEHADEEDDLPEVSTSDEHDRGDEGDPERVDPVSEV